MVMILDTLTLVTDLNLLVLEAVLGNLLMLISIIVSKIDNKMINIVMEEILAIRVDMNLDIELM